LPIAAVTSQQAINACRVPTERLTTVVRNNVLFGEELLQYGDDAIWLYYRDI